MTEKLSRLGDNNQGILERRGCQDSFVAVLEHDFLDWFLQNLLILYDLQEERFLLFFLILLKRHTKKIFWQQSLKSLRLFILQTFCLAVFLILILGKRPRK